MAISKTNKSLSLFPLLALFLMLLNRVNSQDSLSFSFKKFSGDRKDLILQGDAATVSGKSELQLTPSQSSKLGRALYSAPVQLWTSPELVSSFETTFTFSISSSDSIPGDGLAFFIASPDTEIPHNSGGKYLGLFPGYNALKNSTTSSSSHDDDDDQNNTKDVKNASDAVVAVEFDTYPNLDIGDPNFKHIGIDINSIRSKTYTSWAWQNGKTATAHISYNSAAKRLAVVASYPDSSLATLYYDVDLSTILPQWVRVGFSGSTGQQKQSNTILSWSFSSTLQSNKIQKENMHLASVV